MTAASSSAAWTALRARTMPSAASTTIGARIQKVTASPVARLQRRTVGSRWLPSVVMSPP